MKAFTTIAIDGAAASGKTTTSKIIAQKYDFMHISTGEYYRALTYHLISHKMTVDKEEEIQQILSSLDIGSKVIANKSIILINGSVVSDNFLRSTEVNNNVAQFSHLPLIRKFLLQYQRDQLNIAQQHFFHGLIAEGRDTCSVIFPDADLRFLLYADLEERKQRRHQDNEEDCISSRDSIDTNIISGDEKNIIKINTGTNDLQQVENIISRYIEEL